MFGYVILRNLPATQLTVNGHQVDLKKNFLGFDMVPPGKHKITLFDGDQEVELVLEVPSDDAVVWTYDQEGGEFKEESPENAKNLRDWAISGTLEDELMSFPEGESDADSMAEATAQAITQRFTGSQLNKLRKKDTDVVKPDETEIMAVPEELKELEKKMAEKPSKEEKDSENS